MKKNTAIIILALLVASGLFVYVSLKNNGGTGSQALTVPPSPAGSASGCGGCVGVNDNGKTIALAPTARLTLALPAALYDKNALTVTPAGSMGETFGANAAPGDWVRTFEAVVPGTTTIAIPSRAAGVPPYALTLRIVDAAHAWENGMVIVTPAENGGTVHLAKNERFLIQLGDALSWSLSFAPNDVITRVPNTTTADGFQGVYEASATGTAVLHAEGRPICHPGEMCAQFIVEDTVTFVVGA